MNSVADEFTSSVGESGDGSDSAVEGAEECESEGLIGSSVSGSADDEHPARIRTKPVNASRIPRTDSRVRGRGSGMESLSPGLTGTPVARPCEVRP